MITQTNSLHHKLPLVDAHGVPVKLGNQLARGGEGSIYPIVGRPDTVAKIYHNTISSDKASKLAAMAQLSSDRLQKIAAWPSETLHHVAQGPIRGILMPAVLSHREIHVLYGPKTRLREFPDANLPFLLHIAANLARAFTVIHEHGHVIGDVNHGSVLVAKNGTVKLVDCDSFQVFFGQRQFLCTVGVPTHTPPELQGKPLSSIVRNPNHDNFGLAVLIFQLLFIGRHPFAGTFLGNGEPPLEKAIEEYRFAYGPGAPQRLMRQPPATPALESSTPALASLFERAFSSEGYALSKRPSAREWVSVLSDASKHLIVCRQHSGHYYARSLANCPWCSIESAAGVTLFNIALKVPAGTSTIPSFNLDTIWAQIMAIPDPGSPPMLALPSNLPTMPAADVRSHSAELHRLAKVMRVALIMGVVGVVLASVLSAVSSAVFVMVGIAAGGCFAISFAAQRSRQNNAILKTARHQKDAATSHLRELHTRWETEAGNKRFITLRAELERQRKMYQDLPGSRQRQLQDLASGARQRQLTRFLERHRIASASIPNIGQGRKATLQSFNIETAADVTQAALLRVPGFGPTLTATLLAWRASLESGFTFNAQQAIDPMDLRNLDRDIANQRMRIERALSDGASELQLAAQQTSQVRATLSALGEQAHIDLAQAEANLKVLS